MQDTVFAVRKFWKCDPCKVSSSTHGSRCGRWSEEEAIEPNCTQAFFPFSPSPSVCLAWEAKSGSVLAKNTPLWPLCAQPDSVAAKHICTKSRACGEGKISGQIFLPSSSFFVVGMRAFLRSWTLFENVKQLLENTKGFASTLSVCLSVCLSLSLSLSLVCHLCVFVSAVCLSVCLCLSHVFVSVSPSLSLSLCVCVCVSLSLSLCPNVSHNPNTAERGVIYVHSTHNSRNTNIMRTFFECVRDTDDSKGP